MNMFGNSFVRIAMLACVSALVACGGGGGGGGGGDTDTTAPTPSPRPAGIATGSAVVQTVGPAGGTVTTGALELDIPAGALAADTNISITPITTTAPGGRFAFRLGPDGTTFAIPVTLKMTYTAADVNGSADNLMGIAWQDASGIWRMPSAQTRDAINKTVSVQMTHFTDFTMVPGAQLRPPSATVKVNRTAQIVAKQCFVVPTTPPDAELYFVGIDCDDEIITPLPITVSDWSVNGVVGGSASTGTISGSQYGTATFTAPATKPNPNLVAVSARTNMPPFDKTLLVSNITIVNDAARVVARGRYSRTNTTLTSFVVGDVVDEGLTFTFGIPLNSQEIVPWQNIGGGGASLIHDTRTGCMNPTLSGGWDVVSVTDVQWFSVYFNVIGTWSHGAITLGVGEGDCAVYSVTEPAATGDFNRMFSLPIEFFTSTNPALPITQTDLVSGWTWTYDYENTP